jgi:acetyl-CoA carboxylase biotin carboxyl carrier protein
MEMSPETIRALLDAFERSDWREMVVEVGEDRLHVSRDQLTELAPAPVAPPAPAPAPGAAPTTTIPADGTKIESPSVGLFWRAPSPGAPPFVEVGQQVAAGDTVAIVEVMKLMNHVAAPVDGVVTAILVENGESVEFGQPLVVIDPEG